MRPTCAVTKVLIALALTLLGSGPAVAQSFFQSLFGFGAPPAVKVRPALRVPPTLKSFARVSPYGSQGTSMYSAGPQSYPSDGTGSYRTMCVRTCDGFYWPVSTGAPRTRFQRDARVCEETCDSEAKLFYLPRMSDDIGGMTDLSGRAYRELEQAFAYRKKLIAGCSCRPMPWSFAERARHKHYALVELLERQRKEESEPLAEIAGAARESQRAEEDTASGPLVSADLPDEISSSLKPVVLAKAAELPQPDREVAAAAEAEKALDESQAMVVTASLSSAEVMSFDAPKTTVRRLSQTSSVRRASRKSASAVAGWFGGGSAKYTWPGDSPRRSRY
jgi:hypothetical protein